jgi:hypothetical protein
MFVEPQPGSGFDKIAPAYLVRRLLGLLFGRNDKDETGPQVQRRSTATPESERGGANPNHPG